MSTKDLQCPTCNADLILMGDEKPGDTVYCAVCSAPAVIRESEEGEEMDVEEDY